MLKTGYISSHLVVYSRAVAPCEELFPSRLRLFNSTHCWLYLAACKEHLWTFPISSSHPHREHCERQLNSGKRVPPEQPNASFCKSTESSTSSFLVLSLSIALPSSIRGAQKIRSNFKRLICKTCGKEKKIGQDYTTTTKWMKPLAFTSPIPAASWKDVLSRRKRQCCPLWLSEKCWKKKHQFTEHNGKEQASTRYLEREDKGRHWFGRVCVEKNSKSACLGIYLSDNYTQKNCAKTNCMIATFKTAKMK